MPGQEKLFNIRSSKVKAMGFLRNNKPWGFRALRFGEYHWADSAEPKFRINSAVCVEYKIWRQLYSLDSDIFWDRDYSSHL